MAEPGSGFFRGAGGVIWEMSLPLPENMRDQLTKGYLFRANEDGTPYVEVAPKGEEPAEPEVEKPPAANASKAHFVGWAVRFLGMSIDDAEAMTKTDLMELAKRHQEGA